MQTTVKLFICSSAQMIMKNYLQPIIIFLKYQTKVEDKSRAPNQIVLYRVTSKNKKTLVKLAGKHQPGMFLKMFSRCCESFIMETTYECMHA